mmetsp:Transcript_13255/g.17320  ORF Transcript_13255/g.17320 Transcript_13255/m.17320 type:complete len:82 (+) Transcript_13255:115-360(+)
MICQLQPMPVHILRRVTALEVVKAAVEAGGWTSVGKSQGGAPCTGVDRAIALCLDLHSVSWMVGGDGMEVAHSVALVVAHG